MYKSILNQITSLSASVIQVNFYAHSHNIKSKTYRINVHISLPNDIILILSVGLASPFLRRSSGYKNTEAAKLSISLHWISDFVEIQCTIQRHCYTLHHVFFSFSVSRLFSLPTGTTRRQRNKKSEKRTEKRTELKLFSIERFGIRWMVNII